jgi:hypothetical protein
MISLLEELVKGLSRHLVTDENSDEEGSLFCQYHGDHHTRGGEAAFPFVYLGNRTNDNLVIQKGISLADWLLKRQNEDGSWDESPGSWKGTTVFQLMALAALVDMGRPVLPESRIRSYEKAVTNASEWVCKNINFRRVTTNYIASAAAGLALANKVLVEKRWERKARRLARLAVGKINGDGLIEGEGRGRRIFKKVYIKPDGIDIGYGLEMTLASLALYATLTGDRYVVSTIDYAIKEHLYFIYPDGSLDNSLGSRGYKWTIYGSKTTHGSQMALAFAATESPEIMRALNLTTKALGRFIEFGLLSNGPEKDAKEETTCLYPTITRACNLAFALAYFPESHLNEGAIPAEKPLWVKKFPSLNSIVVKKEPWMATISGYGNVTRYPTQKGQRTYYVPGGGSITYLFHSHWGHVQAATQLEYQRIELLHVPEAKNGARSLCPRMVLRKQSGAASSSHARKTEVRYTQEHDKISVQVQGRFFYPEGKGKELRSYYRIEYIFSPDRITKHYHMTLVSPYISMEIIEPIVLESSATFQNTEQGLLIRKSENNLLLMHESPSGHWSKSEEIERIMCPLPSLKALSMICKWEQPGPGDYMASMEILIE